MFEKLPDVKKMAISHVCLVDQDITTSAIHIQSDYFLQFKLNESYFVLPREDIDAIININQVRVDKKKKARHCLINWFAIVNRISILQ